MGRPPQWFTERLIDHLRGEHWKLDARLFDGDADVAIACAASEAKTGTVVISSDADFLTLVPKDDVTLLSPLSAYAVSKRAVLSDLRLTSEQLAAAYLTSGCDNVTWKPKKFGFRTAAKTVLGCQLGMYEARIAQRVDAETRPDVTDMFKQVREVLAIFGWPGI